MKLNKTTLMFEEMTENDLLQVERFCTDIILHGKIQSPLPDYVEEWLVAAGGERYNDLLMISTALPQRLLLSILSNLRERAAKVEAEGLEAEESAILAAVAGRRLRAALAKVQR